MSEPDWSLPMNRTELIAELAAAKQQDELHWRTRKSHLNHIAVLEAELAEWKRMRNEMRDVAFANKARAELAEVELSQAKARVQELSDMRPASLRQRVEQLEAALREIADKADDPHHVAYEEACIARRALTPSETASKPKPKVYLARMTGRDLPCDNCGYGVDDHVGLGMPCPTENRAGK